MNNYLYEPVYEYIKNNDKLLDSVDVALHFGLVEPVTDIICKLIDDGKIKVVQCGIRNYYKIVEENKCLIKSK
jgi:hypothetical protein